MHMISEASSTTTNSSIPSCLKRTGMSLEWSPEEQAILEDGLVRFASHPSPLCYAKIALQLEQKTVRDVVSRAVWFKNKKERNKRRKEDHNASLGKVKVNNKATIPNSFASSPLFQEEYESFMKIVEDNKRLLNQIETNFKSSMILQNLMLFPQCCANFEKLLLLSNENVPDQMKCLPPLPERLSDELNEATINSMLFY